MGVKPYYYQHGQRFYTPDNITSGKLGEKFILRIFETIIGKRRLATHYRIEHNHFDSRYCTEGDSDIRIYKDGDLVLDVEVKNWRLFDRPYSVDVVRDNILPRYDPDAPNHILTISSMNLINDDGVRAIGLNSIVPMEIGEKVTNDNFAVLLKDFFIHHTRNIRALLGLSTKTETAPSYSGNTGNTSSLVNNPYTTYYHIKSNINNQSLPLHNQSLVRTTTPDMDHRSILDYIGITDQT